MRKYFVVSGAPKYQKSTFQLEKTFFPTGKMKKIQVEAFTQGVAILIPYSSHHTPAILMSKAQSRHEAGTKQPESRLQSRKRLFLIEEIIKTLFAIEIEFSIRRDKSHLLSNGMGYDKMVCRVGMSKRATNHLRTISEGTPNHYYSTVTDLARLRGWSTFLPLQTATW